MESKVRVTRGSLSSVKANKFIVAEKEKSREGGFGRSHFWGVDCLGRKGSIFARRHGVDNGYKVDR
jgi:hypothetical protein